MAVAHSSSDDSYVLPVLWITGRLVTPLGDKCTHTPLALCRHFVLRDSVYNGSKLRIEAKSTVYDCIALNSTTLDFLRESGYWIFHFSGLMTGHFCFFDTEN